MKPIDSKIKRTLENAHEALVRLVENYNKHNECLPSIDTLNGMWMTVLEHVDNAASRSKLRSIGCNGYLRNGDSIIVILAIPDKLKHLLKE